jgi:hypothetical protein
MKVNRMNTMAISDVVRLLINHRVRVSHRFFDSSGTLRGYFCDGDRHALEMYNGRDSRNNSRMHFLSTDVNAIVVDDDNVGTIYLKD